MTYEQTITYLYNSTPVFEHVGASAYKEGLENTLALDDHFCHPHRKYMTIHVAGTNGKGSCSHTIASILQEAGYKVGLYTSPHLVEFRERIRVNGQVISKQRVIDFVEQERHFFEPLHPSFFELTTALALKYFAEQQVDIAVVEVGLGGRLDCTNIITPILSVITNISFDHTGFLGNTLAQIAGEKAGIIKKSVPVVIGEYTPETRPVFEQKAKELQAPITFAQDLEPLGKDIEFEMKGDYQRRNKQTILAAVSVLAHSLPRPLATTDIANGLAHVTENTGLLGRWQTIGEKPKVVCDTGHNVGGWQYLSQQISKQKCKTLRIVFGMVDDKDIDTVMDMLPKKAEYYWTQADNHRAIPAEMVAEKGRHHQLRGTIYNKVAEAYAAARKEADRHDFIFIGGSSYVVADLLASLST